MDKTTNAYEAMGSQLALLPFMTSLGSLYENSFSEEELAALKHSLQIATASLIRARQYYRLDKESVDACAKGFANELANLYVVWRLESKPLRQTMQVDNDEWELAFDPGSNTDLMRTDEKGRVWRRVTPMDSEMPF
jgi:hypothetical protein